MNNKETEIIVILDRSGSMESIAQATVEGFNTFLNEQKNATGDAFLTLVQFDHQYEVNYKSVPVKNIPNLIYRETYIPRGSTMLYGAIGRTINELETNRDVIFVIITDGQDNVVSEYKPDAIKKMIETLQTENNYKFVFLAANQDAIISGGNLGIKSSNSMSYAATTDGMKNSFHAVSSNMVSYRRSAGSGDLEFSDEQRSKSI